MCFNQRNATLIIDTRENEKKKQPIRQPQGILEQTTFQKLRNFQQKTISKSTNQRINAPAKSPFMSSLFSPVGQHILSSILSFFCFRSFVSSHHSNTSETKVRTFNFENSKPELTNQKRKLLQILLPTLIPMCELFEFDS